MQKPLAFGTNLKNKHMRCALVSVPRGTTFDIARRSIKIAYHGFSKEAGSRHSLDYTVARYYCLGRVQLCLFWSNEEGIVKIDIEDNGEPFTACRLCVRYVLKTG